MSYNGFNVTATGKLCSNGHATMVSTVGASLTGCPVVDCDSYVSMADHAAVGAEIVERAFRELAALVPAYEIEPARDCYNSGDVLSAIEWAEDHCEHTVIPARRSAWDYLAYALGG